MKMEHSIPTASYQEPKEIPPEQLESDPIDTIFIATCFVDLFLGLKSVQFMPYQPW
jgi:hypothetical protein